MTRLMTDTAAHPNADAAAPADATASADVIVSAAPAATADTADVATVTHTAEAGSRATSTSPSLGVALITKNAARHLHACLSAVRFADDIVVLDSGSTDATLRIAREQGARVAIDTDWQGFGVQKNRAIALLKTDWILLIDADEVVSDALAIAIQAVVRGAGAASRTASDNDTSSTRNTSGSTPLSDTYALDRLSRFCGRWIRHSGWRPDTVPRLFRRGTAHFSDDRVHERLVFAGPAPTLDGLLLHYSYDDISEVLRKLDSYSALGAQQRFERGASAGLAKAVSRALWAFVRTYLLKRGFLDGAAGFMIATLNAQTVYYRFLRLAELNAAQHNTVPKHPHAPSP